MSMRPRVRVQLVLAALIGTCLRGPAVMAEPAPATVRNFAVEALRLEMQLVPQAAPDRAGTPEFAATLRQLMTVDNDGERLMGQLIAQGLRPSPVLARTLHRLPPVHSGLPLPTVEEYRAAIAELQAWRPGEPTPAEAGAQPANPVPAANTRPASVPATAVPAPTVDVTYESPRVSRRFQFSPASIVAAGVAAILAMVAIVHFVTRRSGPRSLASIALTDALTGTGNRHKFDQDFAALANGPLTRLSILMIDVDHFKEVNDRYGHLTGDDVLRRVGRVLQAQVRPADQVYRYGGEEFCAVLRNASFAEARRVADRLCAAVALTRMPTDRPVTVSVGMAAGPSSQLETILRRADSALYDAKRSGRNRVEVHVAAAS